MLRDFEKHSLNGWKNPDVCIVGAGAAGISLARGLKDSGLEVLLLESGGSDYEKKTQAMAQGKNIGYDYYNLEDARLRFFGGTTAIWGGRCAELDDIDFEERSWVPHSGWPIKKADLNDYYTQARSMLELPEVPNNGPPEAKPNPVDPKYVDVAYWQFDDQFDRFTLRKCSDLADDTNIRIVLHANVTELKMNKAKSAIETIEISTAGGKRETITPKKVILATGGLENPRILLASNIGNEHDQVGRYFMEHPHARGGLIVPADHDKFSDLFKVYSHHDGIRYGMLFRPADGLQKDKKILNTSFSLRPSRHEGRNQVFYSRIYNRLRHKMAPTRFGRKLWSIVKRASRFAQSHVLPQQMSGKGKFGADGIYSVIRAEQAPNPDSRVVLSQDKDALGVPKIKLDWKFSDLDKESAKVLLEAFDCGLKDRGYGKSVLAEWFDDKSLEWQHDPLISNHDKGGFHHMGTTRMGKDPKKSVVNADCQVHGVKNLYVVGSSVFTTSGWANPTLTILALSLRLADHLKAQKKA
ncbi:MAG: oxidoreductase [Magnetococcales bacterium]|nr:oxidoreductase [Magnetococcales bacterium]